MHEFKIKPDKVPFIYYSFFKFFLFVLFICLIIIPIIIFGVQNMVVLGLFLFLVLIICLVSYFYLVVRYNKEVYFFRGNRIIARRGGFFSDHETELVVQNITQVRMNLPFIEYGLFKTGNLLIEAAGSSGTEIYLSSVKKTSDLYAKVIDFMEEHGFELKRENLIQKEIPNGLAVFLQVFGGYVFLFFFALIFSIVFAFAIGSFLGIYAGVFLFIFILFLFILGAFLNFMYLKRRTYYLYKDMIEYSQVFLSQNYSFIPIENLANCEITQTFFEKLFNLYDVKLSCQGAQNNIRFTNIANGKRFKSNVDRLIEETPSLMGKGRMHSTSGSNSHGKVKIKKEKHVNFELPKSDFTKELRMQTFRSLFVFLVGFIFAILIIGLVFSFLTLFNFDDFFGDFFSVFLYAVFFYIVSFFYQVIRIYFTRFNVNRSSISEEFSFLTSRNMEFTLDKITSVIIKENLFDRWFGSVSVYFTSIGSGQNIGFINVKKDDSFIKNVLLKTGFNSKHIQHEARSSFSLIEMLKSGFFFVIVVLFLILVSFIVFIFYWYAIFFPILVFLLILFSYVFGKIHYYFSKIIFYDNFVYFQKGWIFKEFHYVLYHNIKDMISVEYPFSNKGSLTFNVAGETLVQDPKNKKKVSLVSSVFTIHFLDHVKKYHDYSDSFLSNFSFGQKGIKHYDGGLEHNILKVKPNLGNYLFFVILVSFILFPLIVLLPISILVTVIIVKRISYFVQPERVIKKSGVFYKKKITILHNRIDHLTKGQGFVNKLFSNGNLEVLTIGSGVPEMRVNNIKEYNSVYSKIEEFY